MASNVDMKNLEKSFRATTDSLLQKNITEYLNGLKDIRYTKLLQVDTPQYTIEERNIIIGELRIIEKLIGVLDPKS